MLALKYRNAIPYSRRSLVSWGKYLNQILLLAVFWIETMNVASVSCFSLSNFPPPCNLNQNFKINTDLKILLIQTHNLSCFEISDVSVVSFIINLH